MRIDKHSNIPLYAQLKELLLERIQIGLYPAGKQIPSEQALCEELQLSRPTVRQAIAELVSEGTLVINKGRGTFVAADPERLDILNFSPFTFSFLSMKSLDGMQLQNIQRLETHEEMEKQFGAIGSSHLGFWNIHWLLQADEKVFGWCQTFIPVYMFPDLAQDITAERRMVDMMANKYAYLPQKGNCKVLVRAASDEESQHLDISRRSPVLAIQARLVSRSSNICEIVQVALRPDLIQLSLDQGRS